MALFQAVTGKDVVAEDHGDGVAADELLTQQKGLSQPIRRGLNRVGQMQAELAAVPQQLFKPGGVLGGGNNQNIPDTGAHQRGHGIINHGLVVNGQKLLRGDAGQGIQARAGASREDNTFHNHLSLGFLRRCAAENRQDGARLRIYCTSLYPLCQ